MVFIVARHLYLNAVVNTIIKKLQVQAFGINCFQ